MDERRVARSYRVSRSWLKVWRYSFGLYEYTEDDLATIGGTYDAVLAALDDLFNNLMTALESKGFMNNTVVILTSDHWEQLGEHHMLEHQYSLYNPLIRVPLVVRDPQRFSPGRGRRPTMTFDIFPTLLELAEAAPPDGFVSESRSLLAPQADRVRLAEYLVHFDVAIKGIKRLRPGWDSRPWERKLRAQIAGDHKFIWVCDAKHELYNIRRDPTELDNLFAYETGLAQRMQVRLKAYLATLTIRNGQVKDVSPLSEEQLRRHRSLGYVAPPETSDSADAPAE